VFSDCFLEWVTIDRPDNWNIFFFQALCRWIGKGGCSMLHCLKGIDLRSDGGGAPDIDFRPIRSIFFSASESFATPNLSIFDIC
jgi:hypothetical protein